MQPAQRFPRLVWRLSGLLQRPFVVNHGPDVLPRIVANACAHIGWQALSVPIDAADVIRLEIDDLLRAAEGFAVRARRTPTCTTQRKIARPTHAPPVTSATRIVPHSHVGLL